MSVLSNRGAAGTSDAASHGAATTGAVDAAGADAAASLDLTAVSGPVMFCVLDARVGEVSILHGDAEVIVRDHQLVERILHVAQRVTV